MSLNKRKLFIVLLLFLAFGFTDSHSVPVGPGQWFTLNLTDGSKVRAELYGDEWFTYYLDLDKTPYIQVGHDTYQQITNELLDSYMAEAHAEASKHRSRRLAPKSPNKIGLAPDVSIFTGTKKGLVILVQFQDASFDETIFPEYGVSNVNALYQRITNEKDFHANVFQGSVKDYFYDQSRGKFNLDFDVVGPLTLSQNRAFYGGEQYLKSGENYKYKAKDARRGTLAYESILAADAAGVDFSQYDWDGDGKVEQVFILFASQGQADGGSNECIWPHMGDNIYSSLVSEDNLAANGNYYYYDGNAYQPFEAVDHSACTSSGIHLDGKYINVYACSQELTTKYKYDSQLGQNVNNGTQISGIGTFCHEFSHCLGFPDTYDTSGNNRIGMGHWDLMCSGNYNGKINGSGGYCPAGYTAFERWCAGWLTPTVLDSPQHIVNLKPLGGIPGDIENCGNAYIIYARGNDITGEYYILENRQAANWDKSLPWHGLLIYHVDYNATAWAKNNINNSDHERIRVFQAGGYDKGYLEMDAYPYNPENLVGYVRSEFGITAEEIITTLNTSFSSGLALKNYYNDALTSSSDPAAMYYNGSSTTVAFEGNEITEIKPYSDIDRSVSFMFQKPAATTADHTIALDENVTESQTYGKETDSNLYTSVTLNRTFTKFDTWSTMWLPFSLSYEELKNAFGEHVEIAFFNGVEKDGENHHIVDFSERTNGTQAFVPFLIKISSEDVDADSKYAGPYTFNYVSVGSSDNTPQSVKTGGTFVGTAVKGGIPTGAWFISDNTFYKSVGKSTSRAYRAYFMFTDEIDTGMNVKQANTLFDDEVIEQESSKMEGELRELQNITTRIDGIEVSLDGQAVPANMTIYTISGQRVASEGNALQSLPRGIYIVNGYKFIKK